MITLLLVSSIVLSQAPAADAVERFEQDRFAIGFWVDPPVDAQVEARFEELAAAGFTMGIFNFGTRSPEQQQITLDLCAKHDIKALIKPGSITEEALLEHPACWGYGLRDEPGANDFPPLGEMVAKVRALRPGKLSYINLFPSYASPGRQLDAANYEEYVEKFIEVVNPDVLSMDHYPQFKPDRDGRDGYCVDLAVMRKYALQQDIPFWNFFNVMPYGPHTDPTEAQLRWQIYSSMAYGAKGVLYFCYYTPGGGEFPKGGAIISRDNKPTRHYDQVTRINKAVKNLGAVLMQCKSVAVYRISGEDVPLETLKGAPIVDLQRAKHDPAHDYLIGSFTHTDGRRAVLLNNYRFAYTAWPTVVFDAPMEEVREVDPKTGKEIPLRDDSPDMPGMQLSLDAGEGRLFILP